MRKLILFLLMLFPVATLAQTSAFSVQPLTGERVQVVGGTIFTGSANVTIPNTILSLTDGATNSIFITSAGVLSIGTSGMGTNFPIATVITSNGNIVSITDNRANAIIGSPSSGAFASSVANVIDSTNSTYGVKANAKIVNDASWTNGANPAAITCSNNDCNFTSADTGKMCWGNNISLGTNQVPQGTFTFTSAQAGTCSTTANATSTAAGTFVWGTDDTAAWSAAWTAVLNSAAPTCLLAANGQSITTTSQFIDTRSGTPQWQVCLESAGLTQILPSPGIASCPGANGGCFWDAQAVPQTNLPQYGKLSNFAINGTGFNNGGVAFNNKVGLVLARVEGFNIWVWDWMQGVSNFAAMQLTSPNSFYNLECNNSGSICYNVVSGANGMTWLASSYAGTAGNTCISVGANATLNSLGDFYLGSAGQCVILSAASSTMNMWGDTLNGGTGNQFVDVTGTLYAHGILMVNSQANKIALLTRATGHIYIDSSNIQFTGSTPTCFNVNLVPGGSIFNLWGNTLNCGTDQTAIATSMFTSLSAGWGTTATIGAASGKLWNFSFQINSSGTGQAANPTVLFTYPFTTDHTPKYICTQANSVSPVSLISGMSGASTSTMTPQFNGTPVAGNNYIINCNDSYY